MAWGAPYRELVAAAVVGLAAMGLAMTSQPEGWTHVWPMASAAADKGVVLAAPVLSAMACLITQRRRRARPADLIEALPRRGAAVRLADAVRLLPVAVVVAVAAHLVAWTVAWVRGAAGEPIWRYPVLTATTLAVMTLFGHVVGRCLPQRAMALVAAFGSLAALLAWPRTEVMDFWYVVSVWPQLTVSPTVLAGRVGLVGVLVAAVVAGARRALWRSWSALMVVTSTVLLVSALGAPSVLRDPPGQICTDGAPRVCVWPDNAWYLPQVASAADAAREAVGGTLPLPAQPLLEEGLADQAATGGVVVQGSAVVVRMGAAELGGSIVSAWIDTSPACPGRFAADDAAWDARHRWEVWAFTRMEQAGAGRPVGAELSPADRDLLGEVAGWSEERQIAWAGDQASIAQGCRP